MNYLVVQFVNYKPIYVPRDVEVEEEMKRRLNLQQQNTEEVGNRWYFATKCRFNVLEAEAVGPATSRER